MSNSGERRMIADLLEGRVDTEIYLSNSTQLSVKAFRGEIASFTRANTAGLSSRVIVDQRVGSAYTERVTQTESERTVEAATRNAAFPEPDPGNVLLGSESIDSYDARTGRLDKVPMNEKRDLAIAIEDTALKLDERIVNVPYAFYGESTGDSLLGNSYGVLQDYRYGYCYAYGSVMAREGDTTEIGSHVSVAADFAELDAAHIAKEAVRKALERIGGTEPESGSYAVVFDEEAATSLIGAFVAGGVSPFFGENIQKGRSKLDGRLGEAIGSEAFTLIDDPMSGIAPRPFDDEGVATKKIAFVDAGVFSSVIHNLYSATRGDSTTTGHASRGGYRGGISTSLHNPYLTNGELSFDALVERAGDGILVNSVEGLHSGLNPISGDFSVGAKGFAISNGRVGAPLKNMVVAGNFYELISRIDAKASDRRLLVHEPFSSPSILISELSVSGA